MPSPRPPLTRQLLIDRFVAAAKPRAAFRAGVELERHLLRPDTGMPVPYDGPSGVRWLLEAMAKNGWEIEHEGDNPIALYRDGASVTLEPGSQYELSTAAFPDLASIEAQSAAFVHELERVIGKAPIVPVALGYTPFATVDQIPWVPKGRYVVMREHLGHTGPLAHHMMKSTCAVQASFDFSDEADCARKTGVGIRLGPLVTAMYANSPLTGGRPNGWMSFRGHVWTQTDPRRTVGSPGTELEFAL